MRQDEGDCNHDDDQPGTGLDQAEQPETYLEGTQKIILLRYLNQSQHIYTYMQVLKNYIRYLKRYLTHFEDIFSNMKISDISEDM